MLTSKHARLYYKLTANAYLDILKALWVHKPLFTILQIIRYNPIITLIPV